VKRFDAHERALLSNGVARTSLGCPWSPRPATVPGSFCGPEPEAPTIALRLALPRYSPAERPVPQHPSAARRYIERA
jgi:hypothetical protein